MDLTLKRTAYKPFGIFGTLSDSLGQIAVTLEHAYTDSVSFKWAPKIHAGVYTCVRGVHALKNGVPFETFEITGVYGHTGLLLHKGNFDRDSEGCVLLGQTLAPYGADEMVVSSAIAFDRFMQLQDGIDTFKLTVL